MGKTIRLIIYMTIVMSAASLCACGKKAVNKEAEYFIYHINSNFDGIISKPYNTDTQEQDRIIKEFMEELQKNQPKEGYVSTLPDIVTVNGFDVAQGVLTIDFSKEYYKIDNETELLCRASVVLTLDQINGIDSISFTVDGKPLKIDGEIVSAMNSNSFSSYLSRNNSDFVSDDFKLYFANASGTKLKEYDLKNVNYAGMSKEEFIVRELIKGPTKGDYTETLSPDVYVNSVVTVDNICYVDFDENFLTEQSPVSNKLVIYSIVNSILELTDINKVQISVNGDSDVYYRNDISLQNAFIRNLDLVEK